MNKEFHNLFPQAVPTRWPAVFQRGQLSVPLSDMGVSVSNVTFEPVAVNWIM